LQFQFTIQLKIYYNTENLNIDRPVVTVGIFDGVHKGHKYIIKKLSEISEIMDGSPVIVTLWPHPRHLLNNDSSDTRLITTFEEKIKILSELGVKNLIVKDFTPELSRLTACEFIEKVLAEEIGIRHLVMGYNHRFGSDREGDISKIRDCARKFSITVEQLDQFIDGGKEISSSEIRKALMKGDVKSAGNLLGHHFFISGSVVGGSRIGRSIGFPTANITPGHFLKILPHDGVYAVDVETGDGWFRGMLNIGIRPTINDNPDHKTIEVHIIDFEKDIYGQQIHLHFIERIRDEMKFQSVQKLKEQLIKDKANVIDIYKKNARDDKE
jgi:riboflavin kinase/FMN adenylyltransferase